ncbi:hypothetical protein V2J09_023064 [Rumex salicifolius]
MEANKKPKAVVVGGSIAGVSAAHALLSAGWDVVILEKSSSAAASTGIPTGAGLGLDPLSCSILQSWLPQHILHRSTLPLPVEQNQMTCEGKKTEAPTVLTRDENFNFRAAYWSDLHSLLYNSLPPQILLWGHQFLDFETLVRDKRPIVSVLAKALNTGEVVEFSGDLLVAADGSFSSVRHHFLPEFKLRYSGYCAWRGVFDFTGMENSKTILGIRNSYPDLGKCLYFDIGQKTHIVIYELMNKRMNWIWYVNRHEPELEGNSVTMKVSPEMIEAMHKEAKKALNIDLARFIGETKDPFLNVIYDADPLERLQWRNVVVVGDAAHPTTPHCLRSTNMSVLDGAVPGKCVEKWGVERMESGLEEYESIRLPVVSSQALHSRKVGRVKQGLNVDGLGEPCCMKEPSEEFCKLLMQKNVPFFDHVPPLLQGDFSVA